MSVQYRRARKIAGYFWFMIVIATLIFLKSTQPLADEEKVYKNLLVNSSFEEGEEGKVPPDWHKATLPDNGESVFVRVKGGRIAESKGMATLEKRGYDTWVYGIQYVSRQIKEGERYNFSVWLRSDESITVQLIVTANGYDENDNIKTEVTNWSPSNVDSTWKKYSSLVTVEEGKGAKKGVVKALINIYTNQPKDITVEIDDAELICLE